MNTEPIRQAGPVKSRFIDSFVPAIFIWASGIFTAMGLKRIYPEPLMGIVYLVVGAFLAYIAVITLLAAMSKRVSRD